MNAPWPGALSWRGRSPCEVHTVTQTGPLGLQRQEPRASTQESARVFPPGFQEPPLLGCNSRPWPREGHRHRQRLAILPQPPPGSSGRLCVGVVRRWNSAPMPAVLGCKILARKHWGLMAKDSWGTSWASGSIFPTWPAARPAERGSHHGTPLLLPDTAARAPGGGRGPALPQLWESPAPHLLSRELVSPLRTHPVPLPSCEAGDNSSCLWDTACLFLGPETLWVTGAFAVHHPQGRWA